MRSEQEVNRAIDRYADTVTRLKAMGKSLADAYSEYSAGNDTVAAGLIAGSIQTFQVTVKLE